jgi:tetratricopeptide (TPR) repeat protein
MPFFRNVFYHQCIMRRVLVLVISLFLAGLLMPAFQPDIGMIRRLFEESLARKEREYGGADPRTAQAARDLGNFLLALHDAPAARVALAEAVRMDEATFGAGASQTLADVAALASVSPPTEAQTLLRRSAESPDPMVAGPALTSLAALRRAAGDRAGAAAALARALEKAELAGGKDSLTVALVLSELVAVVDAKDAVPLLERALTIDQRTLGPGDAQTLQTVRRLAALLRQTGRASRAAELEQQFKGAGAR